MLSTRTGIGLAVGIAVTGIGLFALITSLGLQSTEVNDTYGVGEYTKYRFTAPAHAKQYLEINGTSFHVTLVSPGDGLQIPGVTHKNDISIEWVHLVDGESVLEIQNTGDSELHVSGTLQFLTEFIQITYHIMVITAGLVIIGFSAGFSIRKPKGF